MKTFKGKAIYKPAGKAAEYSEWACNFYVGCSGGCIYCYLKKGRGAAILGGNKPKLKACFKDEYHALEVFKKEVSINLLELQENGLFFSFTTDPMLPETMSLTIDAINICNENSIPVKILTKQARFVDYFIYSYSAKKDLISFGFTLTGHDEIEPGSSTNAERIDAMRKLHNAGFKTFASLEPVIDIDSADDMINKTIGSCDLYKIGLLSGDKTYYDDFGSHALKMAIDQWIYLLRDSNIYFKDSILKAAKINRSELPSNCINRDFKLHEL